MKNPTCPALAPLAASHAGIAVITNPMGTPCEMYMRKKPTSRRRRLSDSAGSADSAPITTRRPVHIRPELRLAVTLSVSEIELRRLCNRNGMKVVCQQRPDQAAGPQLRTARPFAVRLQHPQLSPR